MLEQPKDSSPTRALAHFASSLSFDRIPPEVIAHVKLCILDSLGCALFGATLEWGKIIIDFAKELGAGEGALLWGDGAEVPSANAPLANGTLVHSFEMDDLHRVGVLHPGAEAIPAADAFSRRGPLNGKELLTAIVAGYEVGCRVAIAGGASQLRRGFHPTGLSGTFAAGAAAARALRLDPPRALHALGIAGTQAAGLMAAQQASMVKRMHPGRASQAGVYGALLAARGFTGIEDILEAPYGGFCSTLCEKPDLARLTAGLGERFEALNVGFKPYPCCGSNHTAIDAMKEILRQHPALRPDEVTKITVCATRATRLHVGWRYEPKTLTTAQMNLSYSVAAVLHDRDFFVDQVGEEAIRRRDILETTRKIEVIEDPELEALGDEGRHAVVLEVETGAGRRYRARVLHAKGSDKRPMTAAELETKFRLLASRLLSPQRIDELYEKVAHLERLEEASRLSELLVPDRRG